MNDIAPPRAAATAVLADDERLMRDQLRVRLAEVWRYRDLVGLFVRRDFVAQYKQTILGPLWHIFQPLFTTVIFTVVFGRFAKLPSEGYPYAVFTLCALLPWLYFAKALSGTSDSSRPTSSLWITGGTRKPCTACWRTPNSCARRR